jgi:Histidine kinase-like ATPase domain
MGDAPTEIRLEIPAAPEFLRLARLAAADIASRAGFSYEDIEDLRIGVDELCHLLMAPGTDHEHLDLTFRLLPDAVSVEGAGPPGASHHVAIQSELSRTIVAAVVDEHEVTTVDDVRRFRLLKRAPAH